MAELKSALQVGELNQLRESFLADPGARLAQNAVTNTPVDQVALDRQIVTSIDPSMSDQLDTWPVTNQKKSGRCWLFSALNMLKQHVIAELKVDSFEFSQNYLHFWDKLEKANWFLTEMIALADRPLDDRSVACLLADPIGDGGQWDMFCSLVEKYGVVPKYAMPETESSSNTNQMNTTLQTLLRRGARDVRAAVAAGQDADAVRKAVIAQCYRVLSIHLGTPPTEFVWQWKDKDRNFTRGGTMTPLEFAAKYITVNLDDYVSVVNDPRNPYNTMLTVEHLGNVVGGRPIRYLNVDADVLRDLVKQGILAGRVVWFGCDVGKQFARTQGLWDEHLFDYEGTYGIDIALSKAEQMQLGESAMTHAMLFTGVDILDGAVRRFRVENSWGDDRADKGFDTMNNSWFDEHVFEVAAPVGELSADLRAVLDQDPQVLPLWDPMGSLA